MTATFSFGPIVYLLLDPTGPARGWLESRGTPPHSRIGSTRRLSDHDHTTPASPGRLLFGAVRAMRACYRRSRGVDASASVHAVRSVHGPGRSRAPDDASGGTTRHALLPQ